MGPTEPYVIHDEVKGKDCSHRPINGQHDNVQGENPSKDQQKSKGVPKPVAPICPLCDCTMTFKPARKGDSFTDVLSGPGVVDAEDLVGKTPVQLKWGTPNTSYWVRHGRP